MQKNPTKEDIIQDLRSMFSLKTFVPLCAVASLIFVIHISLPTFLFFAASWVLVFVLLLSHIVMFIAKQCMRLIRSKSAEIEV
jgi:hypothetical protein